jgi:malate dehydrogenase (oxaloacetate-decarboxylating)(NADP+)
MKTFKPTVLLGMTAHSGVFTEELVRTMSAQCERPIIMPMSNPTSNAECTAEEAYRCIYRHMYNIYLCVSVHTWTYLYIYIYICIYIYIHINRWSDGRAVVGTGSPFSPVTLADGRTFTPSQCNNMYVFPGLGKKSLSLYLP